jgi:hypothetical protein
MEELLTMFDYNTDWDQVIPESDKPRMARLETSFRNKMKLLKVDPLDNPKCIDMLEWYFIGFTPTPAKQQELYDSFTSKARFDKMIDTYVKARMSNIHYWKQADYDELMIRLKKPKKSKKRNIPKKRNKKKRNMSKKKRVPKIN